jgi:hypothetical protein
MYLSNYLVRCGKNVPLDGVVMYGTGWHPVEDLEYFTHNFGGLYNQALIFPVKLAYKTTFMPQLKNLLDKETYDKMSEELDAAKYLW